MLQQQNNKEKKMITSCYCVDVTKKQLKVERLDLEDYDRYLHENNLHSLLDLQDYEIMTFKTIPEAENFIDNYLKIYNTLDSQKYKSISKCPKLLLKRVYIPTTLLGMKNKTVRKKPLLNCRNGEIFQLYDQTFFITCKMKEIKQVKINNEIFYEHHYEVLS